MKTLFLSQILIASLLLQAGCTRDPEELVASGKGYLAEGKYKEAVLEFKNAINIRPNFAEGHYQLGLAYLGTGQPGDANREFERAATLDSGHIETRLQYGNLALMMRKFDVARSAAETVLKRDAKNVRAYILLGNSYAGMICLNESAGELKNMLQLEPRLLPPYLDFSADPTFHREPDLAEKAYRQAIALDDRSIDAKLAMADFYQQSRQFPDAERLLKSALEMAPGSRDAKQAMAFYFLQNQKSDLAEEIYADLAHANAKDPADSIALTDFYIGSGNTSKAIEVLNKVIEKNPRYLPARNRLVNLLLMKKDFQSAGQIVDETLQQDSGNVQARVMKGSIMLAQNRTAEAITHLRDVAKAFPQSAMSRYLLGSAYLQSQDIANAEKELTAAVQNDQTFFQAYVPLAEVELAQGNPNAAVAHAMQALALNANLDEAHLVLGKAYLRVNDIGRARVEVESFVKKHPSDPDGLHQFGLLYVSQGNLPQAEINFEKALAADPAHAESLAALSRLHISEKRPERAIARINNAIARVPNNPANYQVLADTYLALHEPAKAEDAQKKALSVTSNSVSQRMALAEFYSKAGITAKSAETLQAIVREDSSNQAAKKRLAELYLNSRNFDKAIEAADDILKANDKDSDALELKGRSLLGQNNVQGAIELLQRAVASSPDSLQKRYYLGFAYLQANDRQRAEAEWVEAAKLPGPFVQAHLALIRLKLESGDRDSALRYAQNAVAANPNSVEAQLMLAALSGKREDFRTAAAKLEEAARQDPKAGLEVSLGVAYLGEGDFARAEAQFETALKNNPDSQEAMEGLVRLYMVQRKPDVAIRRLNQQLATRPNHVPLLNLLGKVYIASKNYASAEEIYARAANANPNDIGAQITLAEFYGSLGKLDKGVYLYDQALSKEPTNTNFKKRLIVFLLNQRSYSRAHKLVDEILKEDAKDTESRILKARLLVAEGQTGEGIAILQAAARDNTTSAATRYYLGVAFAQSGNTEQAVAAWEQTMQIDQRFAQAAVSLANLKLSSGNPGAAVGYAQRALQINPELPDARFLLANAYLSMKATREAVQELELLVSQSPEFAAAHERLGEAYATQGNLAKAEEQFEAALQNDPNDLQSLRMLANVYLKQKNPGRAIQRINRQIAERPEQGRLFEILGEVYAAQNDYAAAEKAYRTVLSIDKNSLSAYSLLGRLFIAQNSTDKAIGEFQNLAKLNPKSTEAQIMLGLIFELRRDFPTAKGHYRQALNIDSHSAVAANNLAWLMAESNENLDEALNLARTATEKLPNNPNVMDTVGWVYYKKKAYRSAIDVFKQCIQTEPGNAVYHYHLGMTYFALGDRESAKASLQRAITIDSSFAGIEQAKRVLSQMS